MPNCILHPAPGGVNRDGRDRRCKRHSFTCLATACITNTSRTTRRGPTWGEGTLTVTEAPPDEAVVHVLWINAGLSCDGDSVALTAATQPSIEEIALGALPGLPKIAVH